MQTLTYSPVHHDPLWKLSETSSKIIPLNINKLIQNCMTLLILEGKCTVVLGIQSGQTHTREDMEDEEMM